MSFHQAAAPMMKHCQLAASSRADHSLFPHAQQHCASKTASKHTIFDEPIALPRLARVYPAVKVNNSSTLQVKLDFWKRLTLGLPLDGYRAAASCSPFFASLALAAPRLSSSCRLDGAVPNFASCLKHAHLNSFFVRGSSSRAFYDRVYM